MRIIVLTITISFVFACTTKSSQIKSMVVSEFSTKKELGELAKDKLEAKYSTGFYENGTQKFFVGLVGYSSNGDTTHYEQTVPLKKEKKGNKNFFYTNDGDLSYATVTKGDTTFFYLGNNLEESYQYNIHNGKKLKIEVNLILGTKKTYTKAKYNKNGECISAIIIKDYIDKKTNETIIYEAEYEYY